MRLVDVDEILADADGAYLEALKECDDEWSKGVVRRIHTVIRGIVSCRPTAYDINKVIDNLHEPAEYINGKYYIAVENAIAIVKEGGIDE